MNPSVPQKERIVALDIIRGLALFGILFINIKGYIILTEGMSIPEFTGVNQWIDTLTLILIEKKFFSIFSFLFGVGFYIFASRAEMRGDRPLRRFSRRLLMMFLIGIVHVFIFWGTILPAYALIGFLLLPFYRAKLAAINKWLAGVVAVYVVALIAKLIGTEGVLSTVLDVIIGDWTLIFTMFLAGFSVAKADLIRRVGECKKQLRLLAAGLLPVVAGFAIWTWFASAGAAESLQLIVSLGTIPTVLFYVAVMFLLLEHAAIRAFFAPVARVGQMALTNYVAQSFIGLLIISIMGLEYVSPVNVVIIASLIFVVQIIYSNVWFKFFAMGPLEKMWRFMTYGKQKAK